MTTLAQLMRSHYVSLNCYLNDAVRTRGDFVRDFLAALVDWNYGDEFAGDTPLFRGETVSDSYLSDLFYAEKPKDWPKYVLRAMLNSHKKSFAAWLSEMSPDEWARVKDNMAEIGVKIENADDFYAAVCESVKNELSEREKPAGEAPMKVEEEKKPEAETSALHIVVRDGLGAAIPFKSAEVAVQSYCMMADNPASHPFLLLSVGESMAELVLNRRTDGQHHLLLPQTVPAEMLLSRKMYMTVTTICHKMPVVLHNTEHNSFFLKKLAEAMAAPDDFVPFDDQNATITFAVRNGFCHERETYDNYHDAFDAWQASPWRRVLTLIYVNDEENLRVTANIAYLNHVHFENVYMKPILVLSDKVKTFLDAYSTGKRTFFGVE